VQQVLLILVVLTAAFAFYVSIPPFFVAMGKKIYPPVVSIAAGSALIIIHIGADAVYGVEYSQTWRGLVLEEISLLIPVAYGLIIGAIAVVLRDGFRRVKSFKNSKKVVSRP
jgi:hypothetical protein